mgnify:CR=1 FL=1
MPSNKLNFKSNLITAIKKSLKEHKIISALSFLSLIGFAITYFLFLYYGSLFIDEVISFFNGDNKVIYLILVSLLVVITYLFDLLYHYLSNLIVSKFIYNIKISFFEKIDKLSYKQIEEEDNIYLFPIIFDDIVRLENNFTNNFISLFREMLMSLFIIVIALILEPLLFVSSIAFSPILIIITILLLWSLLKTKKKIDSSENKNITYKYDSYLNSYLFKDTNSINLRMKKIDKYERKENKNYITYNFLNNLVSSIFALSLFISIFSLILSSSLLLSNNKMITNSSLLQIGFLVFLLNISASKLVNSSKDILLDRLSVKKVKEIINKKEDELNGKEIDFKIDTIKFEDVEFKNKKKKTIYNFSLEIKKETKIALVGQVAAGKSIIYSFLFKDIKPDSGKIKINDIPIEKFSYKTLYDNFTLIDNNPYIYKTTLRNNICLGNSVSDYFLHNVLIDLELGDLIDDLVSGIDTVIDSSSLSKGEKAKIALARAIIKNSQVYLFDEAFASLDSLSSYNIRKKITKYFNDKIVIDICSTKNEIKMLDQIVVIKEGTIVEQGDYKSLLGINGFFASLYKEGFSFE